MTLPERIAVATAYLIVGSTLGFAIFVFGFVIATGALR